jgi:hypothetical protein
MYSSRPNRLLRRCSSRRRARAVQAIFTHACVLIESALQAKHVMFSCCLHRFVSDFLLDLVWAQHLPYYLNDQNARSQWSTIQRNGAFCILVHVYVHVSMIHDEPYKPTACDLLDNDVTTLTLPYIVHEHMQCAVFVCQAQWRPSLNTAQCRESSLITFELEATCTVRFKMVALNLREILQSHSCC